MNEIIKYDNDDIKECLLLFKNNKSILDGVYELHIKSEDIEGRHCIYQWERVKIGRLYYIPQ